MFVGSRIAFTTTCEDPCTDGVPDFSTCHSSIVAQQKETGETTRRKFLGQQKQRAGTVWHDVLLVVLLPDAAKVIVDVVNLSLKPASATAVN